MDGVRRSSRARLVALSTDTLIDCHNWALSLRAAVMVRSEEANVSWREHFGLLLVTVDIRAFFPMIESREGYSLARSSDGGKRRLPWGISISPHFVTTILHVAVMEKLASLPFPGAQLYCFDARSYVAPRERRQLTRTFVTRRVTPVTIERDGIAPPQKQWHVRLSASTCSSARA